MPNRSASPARSPCASAWPLPALWWALFSIVPVRGLQNRGPRKSPQPGESYLGAGLRQLFHTVREIRHYPMTLLFLAAYLIYNDGIQTVIAMAAQFGSEELKFPMATLTTAILITQFVGVAGALLFNRIAQSIGSRRAVVVALAIWSTTLIYIYRGVQSAGEFYAAAAVIGLVLGGSQALSRSLYSLMVPKGQEAEYFSIYEISDKGTSWLGTAAIRPGAAMDRELPHRDPFADCVLRGRHAAAGEGRCPPRRARSRQ